MAKKKSYSASFKATVVLEALRSQATDAEVARQHNVHPVTLSHWKRHFLEHAAEVFSGRDAEKQHQRRINQLEQMLGRKEVELALLRNFTERR